MFGRHQNSALKGVLGAFGAFAIPFGYCTGFLSLDCNEGNHDLRQKVFPGIIRTFFFPALIEEAFWRAFLLPHPAVDKAFPSWAYYAGIIGLFTANHVLSGELCGLAGLMGYQETFRDWRFLFLAAGVGIACTTAYILTGGSLWSATVVHWLAVAAWLFALGGQRRLHP